MKKNIIKLFVKESTKEFEIPNYYYRVISGKTQKFDLVYCTDYDSFHFIKNSGIGTLAEEYFCVIRFDDKYKEKTENLYKSKIESNDEYRKNNLHPNNPDFIYGYYPGQDNTITKEPLIVGSVQNEEFWDIDKDSKVSPQEGNEMFLSPAQEEGKESQPCYLFDISKIPLGVNIEQVIQITSGLTCLCSKEPKTIEEANEIYLKSIQLIKYNEVIPSVLQDSIDNAKQPYPLYRKLDRVYREHPIKAVPGLVNSYRFHNNEEDDSCKGYYEYIVDWDDDYNRNRWFSEQELLKHCIDNTKRQYKSCSIQPDIPTPDVLSAIREIVKKELENSPIFISTNPIVKFKRLFPDVPLPTRGTEYSAGYDLTTLFCKTGSTKEGVHWHEYHTGICVEIPKGYFGLLVLKSFNRRVDSILTNHCDIIDNDYRGELIFFTKPLYNKINPNNMTYLYKEGDKIGQLLILPYNSCTWKEVEELSKTNR